MSSSTNAEHGQPVAISRTLSAASTNATIVSATPGRLRSLILINTTATLYYFKVYNKATTPDENDTPVLTIPVPASATGAGVQADLPRQVRFSAGISFRLVAGIADANTDVAATGVAINLFYE